MELYALIEPFFTGVPLARIYEDAFVIETDNVELIEKIVLDTRWEEQVQ